MDEEFHWLILIRRNKLDLWKRQKRFMDAKKLVGNQHEDSFQTWSGSVQRLAINDPRASAETQAAPRRKESFSWSWERQSHESRRPSLAKSRQTSSGPKRG